MITCRLQIITLALFLFSLMPMHGAEDLATLERTSEAMLQSAFRADNQGTPEEAVAAANASIHAISVAREDRMRPWDWMLQAQLAGMATKHLIRLGNHAQAVRRQDEAWGYLENATEMETAREWKRGQDIPRTISEPTLGVILRTARWDAELLSTAGRNVEAIEMMRKLDHQVTKSGRNGGVYRNQLLNQLISEEKFLGYWNKAMATQDRILKDASADPRAKAVAQLNRAYWRSQYEGPEPQLLKEARDAVAALGNDQSVASHRQARRILAKMAFAYQAAGFDIGDLSTIVAEAEKDGDQLEAIYARRDLAVIQRDTRNFAEAEANLLSSLSALRAIGKKSGEPTAYREYGILLRHTSRARDSIRMIREAIRLTKSFGWTQHLPGLLHSLAQSEHAAGDLAAVKATLAELRALLASGVLEPVRKLDAGVAIAVCLQCLGQSNDAATTITQAAEIAKKDGVPRWTIDWAMTFPLAELKPIKPVIVAANEMITDLQPISIHSVVTPEDLALARFTLSNISPSAMNGTLVIRGENLAATWDDLSGVAQLSVNKTDGAAELRHEISLGSREEFQLIGRAPNDVGGYVTFHWKPATGKEQSVSWTIERAPTDGADVAVTNANLAEKNAFYAIRLHHALSRRNPQQNAPVDLRVVASHPVRIEILSAETGDLLAVDANGDGKLDGPGDMLLADTNRNGSEDILCPADRLTEISLLVYPLSDVKSAPKEISLDVQLLSGKTWETAARNVLK